MGLVDKKPDDELYCPTIHVVSPDPDGIQRSGIITFCMQGSNGRWLGFTPRYLFSRSWNPITHVFDNKENILGKSCYVGRWLTDVTAVGCHVLDGLLQEHEKIGTVVDITYDGTMAMILIDESFGKSIMFSSNGFWIKGHYTSDIFK